MLRHLNQSERCELFVSGYPTKHYRDGRGIGWFAHQHYSAGRLSHSTTLMAATFLAGVMDGRWAGSPEPVAIPVVGPQGEQFHILDFTRLTLESRIDIHPGQKQLLDIAFRADDDPDCYGWNNASYFSNPRWRNPDWRLPQGRYLLKVIISSSGRDFIDCFLLLTDLTRRDFRLESASHSDRAKVLRDR